MNAVKSAGVNERVRLRETLIAQTGAVEPLRRAFLQETYRLSRELLIHDWMPGYEHEPAF